jgi:hypothetical protein
MNECEVLTVRVSSPSHGNFTTPPHRMPVGVLQSSTAAAAEMRTQFWMQALASTNCGRSEDVERNMLVEELALFVEMRQRLPRLSELLDQVLSCPRHGSVYQSLLRSFPCVHINAVREAAVAVFALLHKLPSAEELYVFIAEQLRGRAITSAGELTAVVQRNSSAWNDSLHATSKTTTTDCLGALRRIAACHVTTLRKQTPNSTLDSCTICLNLVESGSVTATTPCHHTFHFECIRPWLSASMCCPNCRGIIAPDQQSTVSPLAIGC